MCIRDRCIGIGNRTGEELHAEHVCNTVGSPAEWKIIVRGITSREPVVGIEHEPNLFCW